MQEPHDGRVVLGKRRDAVENLLAGFLVVPGLQRIAKRAIERIAAGGVADVIKAFFDFGADRRFVFRLGVGDPFEEVV
jgi:hypothetical protein